jgi:3-oxoadipate enol-lactonase
MAKIDLGGETFNVLVEGDETKPALLLANALGTDLHMWDAQVPALTNHFRVVRYDSRGSGSSIIGEGPYSIERLGQDAVAILGALGIERVHFLGLSLGGMVGQWLLTHAPERISRAVLANTAAHFPGPDLWNSRINTAREAGMAPIAEATIERWFTQDFRSNHPDAVTGIAKTLTAAPVEGYAALLAALRDADLREAIRSIKAKVLVIIGKHDALAESENDLAQSIDGAELVTLNAAHLSNVEDAENFTRTIIEFLTAVEVPVKTSPLAKVARRSRTVKRTIGSPIANNTGTPRVAAKIPPAKKAPISKPAAAKAPAAPVVSKPDVGRKAAASKATPSHAVASPAPTARAPVKKAATKTAPVTKTLAKKSPVQQAAAPKTTAKSGAAKKVISQTAPTKNAPTKKVIVKKASVTKAPAKKVAPQKVAPKKVVAKKAAPAKAVAVQAAPKKAAAKKPIAKPAQTRNAPVKKAVVKTAPVKKAVAKSAVAKQAPAKAAARKAPPAKTPAGRKR